MNIKTYKAIKGWGIQDEAQPIPGTERKLHHVIIGETDENYILEDMYEDIVHSLSTEPNAYQVNVKVGREPQVMILREGRIILHNPTTKNHIEYVRKQLQAIPKKTLLNACLEMRINDEIPKKLSDSTMAVVAMVNEEENTFYTASFIYCILKDYIADTYFTTNEHPFAEELRLMEYSELLEISYECIRYQELKESNHPLIKEYFDDLTDNSSFERYIQEEILYRFLSGNIVAKKK